jgi:hypothetical protein
MIPLWQISEPLFCDLFVSDTDICQYCWFIKTVHHGEAINAPSVA